MDTIISGCVWLALAFVRKYVTMIDNQISGAADKFDFQPPIAMCNDRPEAWRFHTFSCYSEKMISRVFKFLNVINV